MRHSARCRSAAAGRSTTTACSAWRRSCCSQILDALRPQIRAGTPSSDSSRAASRCSATSCTNLLPDDDDAKRLRDQTFLLTEFLAQQAPDFSRSDARRARRVVHGHCHHKSVLDFELRGSGPRQAGARLHVLDSGCCGMAGAFGFEKGEHYDVSIACGERVLLPAVREPQRDTLIVANGFSCREQIAQTTDRRAMHIAEVLKMALDRRSDHE